MEELAEIGVEQKWIDGIPHPVLFADSASPPESNRFLTECRRSGLLA